MPLPALLPPALAALAPPVLGTLSSRSPGALSSPALSALSSPSLSALLPPSLGYDTLAIGQSTLAGFLLTLARTGGFVLVAPPFNFRSVAMQARVATAIALALPLSARLAPTAPPLASGELYLQAALQVGMGAALGLFVLVAVSTLQLVGDVIDNLGGFTVSMGLDPLMLVQTSVMGRLTQLVAAALLFVGDGHLMVLAGLTRSVTAMPQPRLSPTALARAVTEDVGQLMVAGLEIAAPVMAALLIADLCLGLLTRAAPALNAFSLGYPLKILLTLLLAGLVVVQFPQVLHAVVTDAVLGIEHLVGG